MTDENALPEARTISVAEIEASLGDGIAENRLYLQISPHFLSVNRPLYFTAYKLCENDRLAPVVAEGDAPPVGLRREVRTRGLKHRFYTRLSQKQGLVAFGTDMLPEILSDDTLSAGERCAVLMNHTTLLSRELFEKPTAYTIHTQQENVARLVDFVLRVPNAIKSLLQITHPDHYVYTHCVNVGLYGLALAMHWLSRRSSSYESVLRNLTTALLLHDLGLNFIPSRVLRKDGPLTGEEVMEVRKHPDYGLQILRREKMLTPESEIVVSQHHERIDGSGYPKALSGKAVHPHARICSLVDAYDALTTRQPYRPARAPFDALKVMKQEMRAQFDPDLFAVFVTVMSQGAGRQ